MGMFDYIDFQAKLPVRKSSFVLDTCNPFQSKSVAQWLEDDRAYLIGCFVLCVTPEGLLLDSDKKYLDWSGVLNFYGSGVRVKWAEFNATFEGGKMTKIEAVEVPTQYQQ